MQVEYSVIFVCLCVQTTNDLRPRCIDAVWSAASGGYSTAGGLGDQKLKMFYEIMLLEWTHMKDLKHLRFTLTPDRVAW